MLRRLAEIYERGLFVDEQITTSDRFEEKPVPEHPVWMKQPAKDAPLPWYLRPIKFNPK